VADTVSVIIPAYNAARFLADSLRSVIQQTRRPEEIIVIDDGSTDDTATIARSFATAVRYVRKPNGGPASARNHGLKLAHGDLVAFQDADDVWIREKLELQPAYLQTHSAYDMVYADLSEVDEDLHVLQPSKFAAERIRPHEGRIFSHQARCGYIFSQTTVIRRAVFDRIGGFKADLRLHEDTHFFLRVAYGSLVGFLPRSTLLRRRHATNLSNTYNEVSLRYLIKVLDGLPRELRLNPLLRLMFRVRRARCYARLSRHDLGMGRSRQARAEALRSLREWPLTAASVYYVLGWAPRNIVGAVKQLKDRASQHSHAR
jgi:glycosyltransferase involved in cell wall biosynthesis